MTMAHGPNLDHALRVDTLDLGAIPKGEVVYRRLTIAHDGLGNPIDIPLMIARGARPGPVFGLTAALHGNELNGIRVIHRLFRELQVDTLRGTLVAAVVVNVPGYLAQERFFDGAIDLNHTMPGLVDGNHAQMYAFRVIDRLVRHVDYLVDLHTASFGRINSLYVRADLSDPVTARMARAQRPEIIVHNPPSDRTLRGAAQALSIPAITVEIANPHRIQPSYVRRTLAGLRAVLSLAGCLPKRTRPDSPPPVVCERSYWIYTDAGGLLTVPPAVTDRLDSGQEIARLVDIFNRPCRTYSAPEAGVVIGKSVNPVAQTGARILHLGVVAQTDTDWKARP